MAGPIESSRSSEREAGSYPYVFVIFKNVEIDDIKLDYFRESPSYRVATMPSHIESIQNGGMNHLFTFRSNGSGGGSVPSRMWSCVAFIS